MVFMNGRFVPENEAVVSVFDRSFLYGDGLFETVRIFNGKPFRWKDHYARMEQGAEFLKLRLPFREPELLAHLSRLIELNQRPDSLLRITLSRGVGLRGYSTKGAETPMLVMSLHPSAPFDPDHPTQWRLITSTVRIVKGDRLARFKTCSKLAHVVARTEAEAVGADEALLLNSDGEVAEAASGNLFWIENRTVFTPPLEAGGLGGTTRALVMELCSELGSTVREKVLSPSSYGQVETMFLSLSSSGIIQITEIDEHPFRPHPFVLQLYAAYCRVLQRETMG